nr:MAG TPA: hypothetical protein [Caudoviricetes sp.]
MISRSVISVGFGVSRLDRFSLPVLGQTGMSRSPCGTVELDGRSMSRRWSGRPSTALWSPYSGLRT